MGAPSSSAFALTPEVSLNVPVQASIDKILGQTTAPFKVEGLLPASGATAATHAAPNDFIKSLLKPQNLIGAALMGEQYAQATGSSPELKKMKALETQGEARAKQLESAIAAEQQGIIPTGQKLEIDQALKQQIAQIRQRYAEMGMSGSTAEANDIQAAQMQGAALATQMGQKMASEGIAQLEGLDTSTQNLLTNIMSAETAQGTELGKLMAEFAGLAGYNPQGAGQSITLNLAKGG
jgi:hypothetical protein